MKLWQVSAIFREKKEREVLYKVFSSHMDKDYLNYLKNEEKIIKNQDRKILDAKIDEDILKELCSHSERVVYYSEKENKIYSFENKDAKKVISLLEAIDLFDHNSIEEVFEKTEAKATPK